MSTLPKIKQPTYSHFLLGLGRKVKYRPFTNKEQKILLLAKEEAEKNPKAVVGAVEQIIENCILDEDIDLDSLATFDIEDIFLRIRSKSVGEVVTAKYSYDYKDEEGIKRTAFASVDINLDDVIVQKSESHSNIVDISSEHKVQMKYPTFSMIDNIKTDEDMAIACMELLIHGDDVYNLHDFSDEEVKDFFNDIDTKGMMNIKEFFDTMPSLQYTAELDFGIKKETVILKGLSDFFT